MRKYPRPGQQPAVRRHPFKECGLKFRRLLARGPKYVAIAKTSSPAEGGGSILPPNPRYSWVLSEQCCSAAEVGGVSSSVWRPSLSGFTPPSVIANGASSLPVSSTPSAGQWVSTETSDGPAIVQRDSARFVNSFPTFGYSAHAGGAVPDFARLSAATASASAARPSRRSGQGSFHIMICAVRGKRMIAAAVVARGACIVASVWLATDTANAEEQVKAGKWEFAVPTPWPA